MAAKVLGTKVYTMMLPLLFYDVIRKIVCHSHGTQTQSGLRTAVIGQSVLIRFNRKYSYCTILVFGQIEWIATKKKQKKVGKRIKIVKTNTKIIKCIP